MHHGSAIFGRYLQSLPEELLASVTEDYIWLADLHFSEAGRDAEFRRRRECCFEECLRRGVPHLYSDARQAITGHAA